MPLTIFIYIKDTCHQLPLDANSTVTIGSAKRNTLTLADSNLEDAHFSFSSQKNQVMLTAKNGVFSKGTEITMSPVSVGDVFNCGETAVYICPKQSDYERAVSLSENREFLIGRSKECAIRFDNKRVSSRHARIAFESGRYKLTDLDSKNHTFVNGKAIASHYLKDGDAIWIGYYGIVFENGELSFLNTGDDLKLNLDEYNIIRRYPYFRRSPRLGSTREFNTIHVQAPPNIGEKPEINWLLVFLPPLGMVGVSVALMYFGGGSLTSLLYLLPMSCITLLTTVISYLAQVRKYSKERKKKIKSYEEYTNQVMAEIEAVYGRQFSSANNANPETEYCYDIVSSRMRRLWERSPEDEDFLEVRLGKGNIPLKTEIVLPQTAVGEDVDPQLAKLQNYVTSMQKVKDIAVTLPVRNARTVGVVGNRQVGIKVVQNAIVQLVTNHSYADLKLAVIAEESNYKEWAWTRWLPHIWDDHRQMRFLSSDRKQASELLGYFEEILKKRADTIARKNEQTDGILPHLVLVITDFSLTESRTFLSLIASADMAIGATAFLLFDSLQKLPKECDWFLELSHSGGFVYPRADSTDRTAFSLDEFQEYEKFSRAMAPVRDRSAVQNSSLPASVTFFQGYGIENVSDLQMFRRWESAKPYESLAAPIGTKENGKAFFFDIHEKAHGPHGLIAGTTGSGKSEVLQTYILSMCIHFSPKDVSFVLIDFKGTGLVGSLKNLPHIAGVITDIDENIQRNLFSLEAEIERRKRLFAAVSNEEKKIQDIYEYQKEYYAGNLQDPLSHLIVVIDEFTELKSRFPDFMAAVDRASRVGRTLGIHLILATQKPGGSVSDETRANSNFKWCLRVKEGESKEVLGRSDAERIPQEYPGRAYIQIGNNEIFELVQIYYSGADIRAKKDDNFVSISFVDAMGRRENVRAGENAGNAGQGKELFALVKYISSEAEKHMALPARKVWETALPTRLFLPDILVKDSDSLYRSEIPAVDSDSLCRAEISAVESRSVLQAVIGIVDDPHRQRQYPCKIDFGMDGHVIIYGAPGTGKTMLLQTIIMSLAERYTPDEVHIYVMDFGSWSMKNLQELPHMGGVANGNEDEKILNLTKMLTDDLDRRKMLFAQIGASNLESYRQASGDQLPSIVVIVDNFAPIREMYPDIENVFVRLSREGSSFGIFLVITAVSLSGSIGYNLSQNFKQALALRMTEKADYRDIVGDTQGLEPAKFPGRGLVRGKPPMEYQTALAVCAENDIEYVSQSKQRCRELAGKWDGSLPKEIPVMPDVILLGQIRGVSANRVVIGLSEEEIAPVTFPCDNRFTLISGVEESGKTNMLRVISRQLARTYEVVTVNADTDSDADRKIMDAVQKAAEEKIVLVIDDFPKWLSDAPYEMADVLEEAVRNQKNNHLCLYAAGDAAEIIQESSGIISKMIRSGSSILLGGSFAEHSSQFEAGNIGYSQQSQPLPANYGYMIRRKKAVLFKAILDIEGK